MRQQLLTSLDDRTNRSEQIDCARSANGNDICKRDINVSWSNWIWSSRIIWTLSLRPLVQLDRQTSPLRRIKAETKCLATPNPGCIMEHQQLFDRYPVHQPIASAEQTRSTDHLLIYAYLRNLWQSCQLLTRIWGMCKFERSSAVTDRYLNLRKM